MVKKENTKASFTSEAEQYSLIQMEYENVKSIRAFLYWVYPLMPMEKLQLKFDRFQGKNTNYNT